MMNQDTGIMSQFRDDQNNALNQLRKAIERPKPKSLNDAIEALPPKQRQMLQNQVELQNLAMQFIRQRNPYYTYKELITGTSKFDPDFTDLLIAVLESLDPSPEIPMEEQAKRKLMQQPQPNGRTIYDNPEFFPQRDLLNNQGHDNPNKRGRKNDRKAATSSSSETVGVAESNYNSVNTALLKYQDTIGNIESANDYSVRGGYNNHYLGKYQMGKAALQDVGIGYSEAEQEAFLSNPSQQDEAFARFTEQNHEYLKSKSEKYRKMDLKEQLSILGYAHNQGRGGALEYLNTGKTQKDGFGTDAQKYIDEVTKALS